jgi:hypothetical protein
MQQVVELVVVSAQVPRDLREKLVQQAQAEDRTLSAEVRRILTRHLEPVDEPEAA